MAQSIASDIAKRCLCVEGIPRGVLANETRVYFTEVLDVFDTGSGKHVFLFGSELAAKFQHQKTPKIKLDSQEGAIELSVELCDASDLHKSWLDQLDKKLKASMKTIYVNTAADVQSLCEVPEHHASEDESKKLSKGDNSNQNVHPTDSNVIHPQPGTGPTGPGWELYLPSSQVYSGEFNPPQSGSDHNINTRMEGNLNNQYPTTPPQPPHSYWCGNMPHLGFPPHFQSGMGNPPSGDRGDQMPPSNFWPPGAQMPSTGEAAQGFGNPYQFPYWFPNYGQFGPPPPYEINTNMISVASSGDELITTEEISTPSNVPSDQSCTEVKSPVDSPLKALTKETIDEPIRMIKVSNLPDGAVEETLINYFENVQRNGGGPIESVEYHPETSSAIVKFQRADAVDRVLKKRPLLFLNKQISVEEYMEKVEADKEEEEQPCHTIEVHGFAESTGEEVLENYFENTKKSGGHDVTSVIIEDGVALVTFADEKAAFNVCEREHTLGGCKLKVSLHLPKKNCSAVEAEEAEGPVCTIEVRGYKVGSEGTIELYFESTKRSGGDKIVNFEPFNSDGVIFITFASQEVAKRVSECQHVVAGCTLDVKLYKPPKLKTATKWTKISSKLPEEVVSHCVIVVRGVTKKIIESLPLYFENKWRSGGGEIAKFEYKEEKEMAYITYESEEVAQRVVTRGPHKLEGQLLKVTWFIPSKHRPFYDDRALFARITRKIKHDLLTIFLEAKIGQTPAEFFVGADGDKIIIRFDKKINFEKLEEACKKYPLEGSYLVPAKVLVSNCIIISNLTITTTEDMVQLYFENEKRSWGGSVEKVEFKREEKYCVVYFEDHMTCNQVLVRKHMLDGSEVQVDVYYECLGRVSQDENGPSLKAPSPVKLDALETERIQKSVPNNVALDKQVQDYLTHNQLPQTGKDSKTLISTLTPDVQAVERVLQKVPLLFLKKQISVEEYVEVVEDIDNGEVEPSCRTIEVCGFAENTEEEVLEMYFENTKRSGGDDVTSVVIEDGVAFVTFKDEKVVPRVMEQNHTVGGKQLSVALHLPKKRPAVMEVEEEEKPVCTVEVRGYKIGSQSTLELYFRNEERSGGGEISKFDSADIDRVLFITFASEEVARRVAGRKHRVADCTLDVNLYAPPKHKSVKNKSRTTSKEPEESVPHCTIEVRGVTSNIVGTLQLYFENKRRSGGDDIVKFEYKAENKIAYITYESEEVAKRVVFHGQHKVQGQPLEVNLYIPRPPRPTYEDRVLFTGLSTKVTQDVLANFLEARTGLTPVRFLFGEDGVRVIITFEEFIDFVKLEEACKKRPLEGSYLQPSKVHVSNCIIIINLKIVTSDDTISLYFENERRSGGGPVENIKFNREEEFCLVFFKDHTVCDRVIQRRHKIDGSDLQVSIYYECLGRISDDGSGPSFKTPKPVKLEGLEYAKMQFLMKSEPNRTAVEKQLQDCYTQIHWPQSETDCTTLTCTWAKQAEQNLHDFLKVILVHEHNVFQEIFETVLQSLQNLVISNPDGVAVFVKKAELSIQVVGHKAVSVVVVKDIEDIIKKAEADFDRKRNKPKLH